MTTSCPKCRTEQPERASVGIDQTGQDREEGHRILEVARARGVVAVFGDVQVPERIPREELVLHHAASPGQEAHPRHGADQVDGDHHGPRRERRPPGHPWGRL